MKRCVFLMLAVLVFLGVVSCKQENVNPNTICVGPPTSMYTSFDFDSYDKLQELTDENSDAYKELVSKIPYQRPKCPLFLPTLTGWADGTVKLAMPQLNMENIDSGHGWFDIWDLSAKEAFDLPSINYNYDVDGAILRIKFSDPSVLQNPEVSNAKSYLEVCSAIDSKSYTPDDFKSKYYSEAYEQNVVLADGTCVRALIREAAPQYDGEKPEQRVSLYYDGMLIDAVCWSKTLSTDDFWSRFGITYIKAKADSDADGTNSSAQTSGMTEESESGAE